MHLPGIPHGELISLSEVWGGYYLSLRGKLLDSSDKNIKFGTKIVLDELIIFPMDSFGILPGDGTQR